MASALAETITTNFLNCSICFETFRDPRALPCQHVFCRKCLEQCLGSSKNKRNLVVLVCPVCREAVKLSKEGVNKLPVHFLVSSLQDTVDVETTKAKIHMSLDTACSNCNASGNKAKVRCLDCREYLCENCFASHKIFKAMKDHKIIPMEDILTGEVNLTKEEEYRNCTVHRKLCEYYCEIENKSLCKDCVILNECPPEHSRISLKKASQIQCDELRDLLQKTNITLKKYNDAVSATNHVTKELEINSQLGKEALENAEKDCIERVKKTFQGFKTDLECTKKERMTSFDQTKTDLQSTIREIKEVTEQTDRLIQTNSEFEVVSAQSSLSCQLQQLSVSQPTAADLKLGYVKFEATTTIPTLGRLLKCGKSGERWKLTSHFCTDEFNGLQGLALDKDDNIVLCSWENGVKVFSRDGKIKCTIYDSHGAVDVAVSPDNRYYSTSKNKQQIFTNERNGIDLNSTPITNVDNEPSNVNSLTVDSDGKIIVGQVSSTISIHNADGSLNSKFATQSRPYRLAATSNGEIVSSVNRGESLQLMDYSGGNVRVIQPPAEVKVWSPGFVCCRQGEIFVCNRPSGKPAGVYRYTSEGDYMGCVTTEVKDPTGIALSKGGMELFVADYTDGWVKILQRP